MRSASQLCPVGSSVFSCFLFRREDRATSPVVSPCIPISPKLLEVHDADGLVLALHLAEALVVLVLEALPHLRNLQGDLDLGLQDARGRLDFVHPVLDRVPAIIRGIADALTTREVEAGVRHDARRQALLAAQSAGRVRHGRQTILSSQVAAVVAHDAGAACVRRLPVVELESGRACLVVAALTVAEARAADTRALQRGFHHSGLAVRILAIHFLEAAEQTSASNRGEDQREHGERCG